MLKHFTITRIFLTVDWIHYVEGDEVWYTLTKFYPELLIGPYKKVGNVFINMNGKHIPYSKLKEVQFWKEQRGSR